MQRNVQQQMDRWVEEQLFEEFLNAGVLLAPGKRCFGVEWKVPWFRLGYAAESSTLERGLQQLDTVIARFDSRVPSRH